MQCLQGDVSDGFCYPQVFELPEESERKGYSTATRAMLDGSKLEGLDWKARVPVGEGLSSTVESLRECIQGSEKGGVSV